MMDSMDIKPNYAALGRKYGLDWRTVKKYHEGYEGKPKKRNKGSKLDAYRHEICDKLRIRRLTVKGVYEFMVRKYGLKRIGTYGNFNTYVSKHKLKPKEVREGHPRYETPAGKQGQIDWKEDISIPSRYGEIFVINVFHHELGFSRFSYLELSLQKRTDDVARCLVNSFKAFGGVPEELLFDNMSTAAIISKNGKKPTEMLTKLAKEFGFRIRFCRARSPETKGSVEARNKIIDWIRAYEGEFETCEELAGIINDINSQMNITVSEETQMSPTALFYKEKEYLKPLPKDQIIESFLCPNKYSVYDDAMIRYGNSRYSVDPKLIGEEVTADLLGDKLCIYYKGKLVTIHPLSEKPMNYRPEHYKTLMQGKVKEQDLEETAMNNLSLMDRLLEDRRIEMTPVAATASAEALITYLNQSPYGKWVINTYAHLSADEKCTFIRGMNRVLPYVKDTEAFISRIKYSMKENNCSTIDFDCWVNDFMAVSEGECILTDEGYEILKHRYGREIDSLLEDMKKEHEEEMTAVPPVQSGYDAPALKLGAPMEELPF